MQVTIMETGIWNWVFIRRAIYDVKSIFLRQIKILISKSVLLKIASFRCKWGAVFP